MRDFKGYLPHHRDSRLDDLDLDGRESNPLALLALIVIVGLLGLALVRGIVHHEEIEEAKAKAALAERQRIVEAVARNVEEHARYEQYLDRLMAKEYRGQ